MFTYYKPCLLNAGRLGLRIMLWNEVSISVFVLIRQHMGNILISWNFDRYDSLAKIYRDTSALNDLNWIDSALNSFVRY